MLWTWALHASALYSRAPGLTGLVTKKSCGSCAVAVCWVLGAKGACSRDEPLGSNSAEAPALGHLGTLGTGLLALGDCDKGLVVALGVTLRLFLVRPFRLLRT